jgi:hypothetical protein
MDASQHLKTYGLTLEQARNFIDQNMKSPAYIYNVARAFKIDSQMLAEIVAPTFPGIGAAQVEDFFTGKGLNGKDLNASVLNPVAPVKSWQGGSPIASHMTFNDNTDTLSTESLREAVIAKVGETKYLKAFNPSALPGSADGVLSTSDLGFSHLGDIEATWQNIESLYYGTVIHLLRGVSISEFDEVLAFQKKNSFWLSINDPSTKTQFNKLMQGFMLDPVTADDPCIFNTNTLATAVTEGLAEIIRIVGVNLNPNTSLFSGWNNA